MSSLALVLALFLPVGFATDDEIKDDHFQIVEAYLDIDSWQIKDQV